MGLKEGLNQTEFQIVFQVSNLQLYVCIYIYIYTSPQQGFFEVEGVLDVNMGRS